MVCPYSCVFARGFAHRFVPCVCKDHIIFAGTLHYRSLDQALFIVSAENCMKVLFLTYDPVTFARTNTIESTWRHVKAFLNPYNRIPLSSLFVK